jgi:hypothetical protein
MRLLHYTPTGISFVIQARLTFDAGILQLDVLAIQRLVVRELVHDHACLAKR